MRSYSSRVGAYNKGRGGGGVTTRVPAVGDGLAASNVMTRKTRLKWRWSCNGQWREILHGETTDGKSLSRHVEGGLGGKRQLRFGDGGFGEWGFIYSKTTSFWCQKHQNNVILMLKKNWIELDNSEWTDRFVRFTNTTASSADSTGSIPVQLVSGLIDWIGLESWPAGLVRFLKPCQKLYSKILI